MLFLKTIDFDGYYIDTIERNIFLQKNL